jgi:hypothetical protein
MPPLQQLPHQSLLTHQALISTVLPVMVLCRFVVPQQHEVLPLSSPSHQQQVHTNTMPGRVPGGPLADIIQDIQIRLDTIEEWMHKDATWKCWVEEMLRRTD